MAENQWVFTGVLVHPNYSDLNSGVHGPKRSDFWLLCLFGNKQTHFEQKHAKNRQTSHFVFSCLDMFSCPEFFFESPGFLYTQKPWTSKHLLRTYLTPIIYLKHLLWKHMDETPSLEAYGCLVNSCQRRTKHSKSLPFVAHCFVFV